MAENNEQNATPAETSHDQQIDQVKLEAIKEELSEDPNLMMAIIMGLIAALVGAFIWAAVTATFEYQIGYMAIGVGILVGFAVKYFGKGYDMKYGIIGAVFSFLGCLLGNLLAIIIMVSKIEEIPLFEIVKSLDMGIIVEIMTSTFEGIDLLFYGLAIYVGYIYAINKVPTTEVKIKDLPTAE